MTKFFQCHLCHCGKSMPGPTKELHAWIAIYEGRQADMLPSQTCRSHSCFCPCQHPWHWLAQVYERMKSMRMTQLGIAQYDFSAHVDSMLGSAMQPSTPSCRT